MSNTPKYEIVVSPEVHDNEPRFRWEIVRDGRRLERPSGTTRKRKTAISIARFEIDCMKRATAHLATSEYRETVNRQTDRWGRAMELWRGDARRILFAAAVGVVAFAVWTAVSFVFPAEERFAYFIGGVGMLLIAVAAELFDYLSK